jgi:DNA-binding PadR family transcriptional regulator
MHRHFGFFRHDEDRRSHDGYGDHHHGHERGERGMRGFGGHHGPRGGRHGRGGGRFFDQGDLRLVILSLIAEEPSHGYQIIKTLEERTGGVYAPSPGVVYPTLTMLEEQGLIEQSGSDGAKKFYAITDEGRAALEAEAATLKAIMARLSESAEHGVGFSPRLIRSQHNLRMALRMRLTQGPLSPEQVEKITAALDACAKAIDEA